MSKITLSDILSGTALTKINTNFQNIEDEFNNKVLYRDNPLGQPNTMQTDIDLNGKVLYNLPVPTLSNQAARLEDVQNSIKGGPGVANLIKYDPTEFNSAMNVQAAIDNVSSFSNGAAGSIYRAVADRMKELVYAEDFSSLSAAVAASAGKQLILNHTYTINNTSNDGLLVNVDNICITGRGTINVTGIAKNAIKVTGKGVTISGITIKGSGAYDTSGTGGAVIPGFIYVDGTGLTSTIDCRIQDITMIDPGKMGVVFYKCVGFEITGCRLISTLPVSTWLNTAANFLIRIYSCAEYQVHANRLHGFSEGIVIQAYPATDYVFSDFGGTTSNKSRKGYVCNNVITGTYDHCIYYSNDNEHFVCNNNVLWMASVAEGGEGTCSLKLEGGYFEAVGNYCREGIQFRNPYYGRLENNIVLIYSGRGTASNPMKMGILSQDVIYQRDFDTVSISNNTIGTVGTVEVDAGIWLEGAVWLGYQSRIKNLSVCNNHITGVGRNSIGNGYGILIQQDMPKDGSNNVIGSVGTGVKVANNIIEMSSFTGYATGMGSFGIQVMNCEKANITGNVISSFTLRGINTLGMRYSYAGGNTISGNTSSGRQRFGIFEESNDLTIHVNGTNNTYDINQVIDCDIKYFPVDQTTVVYDKVQILNVGGNNTSQTISSYDHIDFLLWSPTGAGLTLTFGTTRPWGVGQKISVMNNGSQSFNVTNTSTTIAPGNKVTFCCTGSNAFVAYV